MDAADAAYCVGRGRAFQEGIWHTYHKFNQDSLPCLTRHRVAPISRGEISQGKRHKLNKECLFGQIGVDAADAACCVGRGRCDPPKLYIL